VQHYVAVAGHFGRWLASDRYPIEVLRGGFTAVSMSSSCNRLFSFSPTWIAALGGFFATLTNLFTFTGASAVDSPCQPQP
jgi:hypothetical protein